MRPRQSGYSGEPRDESLTLSLSKRDARRSRASFAARDLTVRQAHHEGRAVSAIPMMTDGVARDLMVRQARHEDCVEGAIPVTTEGAAR
jgi:hypothetical protein